MCFALTSGRWGIVPVVIQPFQIYSNLLAALTGFIDEPGFTERVLNDRKKEAGKENDAPKYDARC
jgi:hypothetical protein